MARTLEEIRASRPTVDRNTMRKTTEADIRRHMVQDGQDPDQPPTGFVLKRGPGQRGPGKKNPKVHVSFRLDPTVLDKYRATGPGWQKRAQEILARGAELLEVGAAVILGKPHSHSGQFVSEKAAASKPRTHVIKTEAAPKQVKARGSHSAEKKTPKARPRGKSGA